MGTSVKSGSRESRDQKFNRVAERRVNTLLDKIRLLGQLSDRRNYDYTDAQVAKIFKAVDDELKAARSKFQEGGAKPRRFTL